MLSTVFIDIVTDFFFFWTQSMTLWVCDMTGFFHGLTFQYLIYSRWVTSKFFLKNLFGLKFCDSICLPWWINYLKIGNDWCTLSSLIFMNDSFFFFFFIDCPVSSVILIDHALRTVSGNSMGGMNLLSILSWTYIYLMGMENPRIFQ